MDPFLAFVCAFAVLVLGGAIAVARLGRRRQVRLLRQVAERFGGAVHPEKLLRYPAAEWTMFGRAVRLSFEALHLSHEDLNVAHTVLRLDLFYDELPRVRFALFGRRGGVFIACPPIGEKGPSQIRLQLKASGLDDTVALFPVEEGDELSKNALRLFTGRGAGFFSGFAEKFDPAVLELAERVFPEEVQQALAAMLREAPWDRFDLLVQDGKLELRLRGHLRKLPALLALIERFEVVCGALLAESPRLARERAEA